VDGFSAAGAWRWIAGAEISPAANISLQSQYQNLREKVMTIVSVG